MFHDFGSRRNRATLACWICWLVGCLTVALLATRVGRADIFVLTNGGQVQGEPQKDPPAGKVIVRTADGQVTLDKTQIDHIIPQSPNLLEFERIRPTFADTAVEQNKLANWCRDHNLSQQRQEVLAHVLELDPDNADARRLLGYAHVGGRWIRRDQAMEEQGFVFYQGRWMLPQERDLIEQRRIDDQKQREWYTTLKRWRAAPDQLADRLANVTDPTAVPALIQMAAGDFDQVMRLAAVDALVNIGTGPAISAVVARSLDDSNEEIRLTSLDKLVHSNHPEILSVYVQGLKSHDNVRVNRAGYCLGQLGDKSAIGPLIDALRTTHHYIENPDEQPGQMTTTFGRGGTPGGGLSISGGPKMVKATLENRQVLAALLHLVNNQVNYQFDQKLWRNWYATQRRSSPAEVRGG